MRALNVKSILVASAFALAALGNAHSAVTTVGSQAEFSALGTIVQNTNWDSYGLGFTTPGNNLTVGDLIFVEGGQNLIGGSDYGMVRNLLTDNFVSGTTAFTANTYDLFAFNAGNFFSGQNANFSVSTNLGTYSFTQFVTSYANNGSLTFIGFAAGAGEYFTSVAWSGAGATGVTDIQLGVAAIPEPETYAMLLAGLGLLGFAARRRKLKEAAAV